jgi:hypothetical protein
MTPKPKSAVLVVKLHSGYAAPSVGAVSHKIREREKQTQSHVPIIAMIAQL